MLRHALKLNWLCLSIFLTVILIGGAPSPSFAAKGPDGAYNFLCGQIKGIGIIDSHVDAFSDSYTYDNALAVIAFTAKEDYARAQNILAAYKNNIDTPLCGGYYDVYDYATGIGRGNISAGPNAWLLDAINFYHYKTGDAQFADIAGMLADYLVNLRDEADGGIFGDDYASWKSTEHNLDAYAGLYNYGLLNNKDLYIQKAELIKDFLTRECWNGERFLRGKNDPIEITDVQSLGILSLGINYASAIYWAEYHTKCAKPLYGMSITGFDYNTDLDTVWLEGTLQAAMAFMKNRDDYRAGIYFDNVDRTQRSSGSFLCATNEGTTGTDWILLPTESVAPTCWYLFYATGINPLEAPLKLAAQDTTPPAIIHTPIICVPMYRPITFTAVVTDSVSGVKEVTLYWRKRIRRIFWWEWSDLRSLTMTAKENGRYEATLFASQVRDRKIKYYITAKDKAGNSKSTGTYTIAR